MKVSNINQNIYFQKILKAKAVLKNAPDKEFSIFELERDKKEDKNYFKYLRQDSDWKEGRFLTQLSKNIKRSPKKRSFYVVEDETGKCYGYCSTRNLSKEMEDLEYISTYNGSDSANSKGRIKNLGELLLVFLSHNAYKNDKDLFITAPLPFVFGFYQQFGFKEPEGKNMQDSLILKKEDIESQLLSKRHEKKLAIDFFG